MLLRLEGLLVGIQLHKTAVLAFPDLSPRPCSFPCLAPGFCCLEGGACAAPLGSGASAPRLSPKPPPKLSACEGKWHVTCTGLPSTATATATAREGKQRTSPKPRSHLKDTTTPTLPTRLPGPSPGPEDSLSGGEQEDTYGNSMKLREPRPTGPCVRQGGDRPSLGAGAVSLRQRLEVHGEGLFFSLERPLPVGLS